MDVEFRWDKLSDSLREPFVGIVAHAKFDCDCVLCQKAPISTNNRLHIGIVPLDKEIDCQNAWFNYSPKKWSSWGAFCLSMHKLNLSIGVSSVNELLEKLKNTVFEWHSVKVINYIEQNTGIKAPAKLPEALMKKETWLPVRIVKLNELEFVMLKSIKAVVGELTIENIRQYAENKWEQHLREHENVEEVSADNVDIEYSPGI